LLHYKNLDINQLKDNTNN